MSKETSDSEKENTFHEHLFVGVVGGLSEFASLVEDEGEDCAREYTERRVSSLAGEGGARAAGEKDLSPEGKEWEEEEEGVMRLLLGRAERRASRAREVTR